MLHDCAADRPKRYALTLKDEMPGRRDDGRERSTVSWEAAFQPSTAPAETADRRVVLLRWDDFVPTYRGREKRDARPLDPSAIKRIGLMMRRCVGNGDEGAQNKPQTPNQPKPTKPRHVKITTGLLTPHNSFFNDQEGDFQLDLHSIAAVREPLGHTHELRPAQLDDGGEDDEEMEWKRHLDVTSRTSGPPWWKTLSCGIL